MKKTILFVFSISMAASIGFIFGFHFYEAYKFNQADLIKMTIKQTDELTALSENYKNLKAAKKIVNDLNSVSTLGDLAELKESYSNSLKTHIENYENRSSKTKQGKSTTYIFEPVDNQVNKIKADL
ncbi:hypothetical protein [Marinicellulosiphila megalodicopiae]|uniref:hypothetical protein n=1 Tax=Marinicellulosiphila megalodicopiae TaxID=2724896 RepID=UPI003BAF41B7